MYMVLKNQLKQLRKTQLRKQQFFILGIFQIAPTAMHKLTLQGGLQEPVPNYSNYRFTEVEVSESM